MVVKAVFVGIIVLAIIFMCTLLRFNLFGYLRDMMYTFNRAISGKSREFHNDTHYQFERMTLDQKRKSKKYAFYNFINEVLAVFQLKERGITVEGFCIGIVVIWFLVGLLFTIVSTNLVFVFIIPLLAVPTTIAGIFLASRVGVRRRKRMLLDSMDLVCAVMSDGILSAVKGCLMQFPDEVRPYFEHFIKNIELLNMSVPDAVRTLNREVGSLYDEFCSSVIIYEENRATGLSTLFNFYIEENAKTLERDRAIKRMSDAVNMDFFASIGAVILFAAITSTTMTGGAGLWIQPVGIVIAIILLSGAVGVFTYIQYLLSKPYIYNEKE